MRKRRKSFAKYLEQEVEVPNKVLKLTQQSLRLFANALRALLRKHPLQLLRNLARRSSARSADERARVVPNIGFSARSAVEPSLERHRFAATLSSRTRVPAAHRRRKNSSVFRRGGSSAPCGMTFNSRPLAF